MGTKLKIFKISAGSLLIISALIFGISLFGLGYYKFFAPKYEDAKRDVFENTKSYLHGVQQDLGKYYFEYQNADEEGKAAIKAVIRIRFAEVDESKLQSVKLQSFLRNTRGY